MKNKFKWILTACSVITLCAGAIAFSACDENEVSVKEHEHDWGDYIVKTPATCTQEGERYRKCTVPGCTATSEPEPIQKKPHTFGPEKNTATCTESGNMVRECTVCGYQEVGAETEPTGHNMIEDHVWAEASCTQEGDVDLKCSKCDYRQEHVKYPKMEHAWTRNPLLSVPVTCLENGLDHFDCISVGCGATKEEVVYAKGHTEEYTSFQYPTFEEAGSCVGKCAVCGENLSKKMDKLENGKPTEFTFKVVRNNGQMIVTTHNIKIVVKDWNGNVVKEAGEKDLKFGVLHLDLPVEQGKKYSAEVSGLGSYGTGSVEVDPVYPVGEIKVKSKGLYEIGAENLPAKIGQGNLAVDFELNDIDGKTVHLKDVLQKNKVVMLHFFYTSCTWCNTEYPGFVKAYNACKELGVEAIGIAPDIWANNTVEDLRAEVAKYTIPFPIVLDEGKVGGYIYQRFNGISGAPSTVFIDHEGVILKIQSGYLSADSNDRAGKYTDVAYKALLKEYTTGDWDDLSTQNIFPEEISNCEYLLPGKEY